MTKTTITEAARWFLPHPFATEDQPDDATRAALLLARADKRTTGLAARCAEALGDLLWEAGDWHFLSMSVQAGAAEGLSPAAWLEGALAQIRTEITAVRAEAKLADAALLAHFRGVTGGDEVSRGKPEPDIYLLAASRLGVAAPHCLAIEDSEPGFLAAHRAGMAVVFVPDQAPPSPSLLAHVPRIAATLDDVRNWLSSLPPAADADPHARRA